MTKERTYTGINIQYPISRLILEGKKTVETRTYPIPKHYIGKELAIIETPGKTGNFKARIVGLICFSESFLYESEESFYKDTKRHCVTPDSPWKWTPEKPKWGWAVTFVNPFKKTIPAPEKKGIKFTKEIQINI
jgi:hypothetical protein